MYMYEAEISVAMYLWKKGMGVVYEDNKNDQGNIFCAYDVAIEQCTQALHTKFEDEPKY